MIAHGFVTRETKDIDLFTEIDDAEAVRVAAALRRALHGQGLITRDGDRRAPACSVIVRFVLPGGRDRWAALKGRGHAPCSWIAGGRQRRMITKGMISAHLLIYGRCRASREHAGALPSPVDKWNGRGGGNNNRPGNSDNPPPLQPAQIPLTRAALWNGALVQPTDAGAYPNARTRANATNCGRPPWLHM